MSEPPTSPPGAARSGRAQPRVVIVGGGFAGVAAARALQASQADVVLIDRRNHQIFQPLLYQVATAVLAPADVAAPIRQIAATQRNLTVKMAEVSRDFGLDVLHVHYAVPHATAAILARDMMPNSPRPKVVTTLHGTDTTLLGRDAGYGPAIRHALECSDAITTVSALLTGPVVGG